MPTLPQIVQAIVTLALLAVALYLIVARPNEMASQLWAGATVGSIITYWLSRPPPPGEEAITAHEANSRTDQR